MTRDLRELAGKVYDLLIIGGGIYGACVAWEAALRGLSVALVEKADFCAATSANSLKIIHGGFRYLQHADFKRMRESIRERMTLMRIAPHLVHPLPVLIPTYGHGMCGKEVLALALMVNDLVGFDRNRLEDPQKHIPRGRMISKGEALRLLPDIHQESLTGGVIFHDAQVYNSERLLLSFLRSAEKLGTVPANYVEVTGFLHKGYRVIGVKAKDVLTGDRLNILARIVVNASGPWVNRILGYLNGHQPNCRVLFAKAINLVTAPLSQTYAVGIASKEKDRHGGVTVNRGNRFLFMAPWRGHSLIGTAYTPYDRNPDDFTVTEQDVQSFLDDINQAFPWAKLTMREVSFVHGGLLPCSGLDQKTGSMQLSQHYQIHDHRGQGVQGLISLIGVKYTTARHVAEKVVDRVFEIWGYKPPKSVSSVTPLRGGQIERFDRFLHAEGTKRPYGLGEEAVRRLVYNYGSAYTEVLRHLDGHAEARRMRTDPLVVLKAEVLHGVRDEMAQKLSDVVFRRTELGTAGPPGDRYLRTCADVMGRDLGWSPAKIQRELGEVNDVFASVGRQ